MRKWIALGLLALVAAVAVAFPTVARPTRAAWSDSAHFRATASAGTWTVAPTNSCTIWRNVAGAPTLQTGKTCTVTGIKTDFWGTAGNRTANLDLTFTHTGASHPDYLRFTIDLATSSLPTNWNWSTTGLASGGGVVVESSCTLLPKLSGSHNQNWGPRTQLHNTVYENRQGKSASCP